MFTLKELTENLDEVSSGTSYDLLKGLFIPFENNTRSASEMELFALAIDSVKRAIQDFQATGILHKDLRHIDGLYDYNPLGLFYN